MSWRVAMLVSNACAPDRRVLREAQALVGQGHQVTVIAWDREGHYPPGEVMEDVQVERIGVASAYGAGLRRLAKWPAFARQALARLRQGEWDVVHCHDLDTLPIGYVYTRRRQVPLIFDAHESYPDLVAPRLPGWAVAGLRAVERFLVQRVDALITVGDLLADHYRRWAWRVVVVRNCQATLAEPADPAVLRASWSLTDAGLVVCYIGGFTHGRVILPLLETVCADPRWSLVLVGEGPQASAVMAAIEGVDRIVYLGQRVPPEQVISIMQAADVVYYGLRADYPNNHFSSPNALYSALAAGRPLVTTAVGEIGQIVEQEQCGVILDEPTAESIKAALEQLHQADFRESLARNVQRVAETKYNWVAAKRALLQLYQSL